MPAILERKSSELDYDRTAILKKEVETEYYGSYPYFFSSIPTRTQVPQTSQFYIQNNYRGIIKLRNIIFDIHPDTITEDTVEGGEATLFVIKKNDYTLHLTIYQDEYENRNPEIILNMFRKNEKLKSYYDNLSEIDYVISSLLF